MSKSVRSKTRVKLAPQNTHALGDMRVFCLKGNRVRNKLNICFAILNKNIRLSGGNLVTGST